MYANSLKNRVYKQWIESEKIYFKLLHCTFITICYFAHVRTKLSYTCNLDCLRIYNSNWVTTTIIPNVELFYVRCSNATVLRWKRWFNQVSKSDWVCTYELVSVQTVETYVIEVEIGKISVNERAWGISTR